MTRLRLAVLGLTAFALLTALAATVDARSAAPGYGVGLKLGKVVNTIPVGSSIGPWLVWNRKTCSYQVAAVASEGVRRDRAQGRRRAEQDRVHALRRHRPVRRRELREHEEDGPPRAGFQLDVYNLKYPSTTEPLNQARNAVLTKDAGVIQAQQLAPSRTRTSRSSRRRAASPAYRCTSTSRTCPRSARSGRTSGRRRACGSPSSAKAKGWAPTDTALVECTDPDVGSSVNVMFDTAPKALVANGFASRAATSTRSSASTRRRSRPRST